MINRLLVYVFSLYVILTPTLTYAGAAELWKYEPELKNMNIQLTGHKVDQLGNAVNDSVYKRTIDPKVGAARTAQGTVGMGRLLRVSGWGLLGTYALEKLLEGVGWVIDPATQSIWRNKPQDSTGPGYSCSGTMFYNGRFYNVKWEAPGSGLQNCPLEAANEFLKYKKEIDPNHFNYEFIRWGEERNKNLEGWTKLFYFTAPWGEDYTVVGAVRQEPSNLPQDRETMTPDILSDYVNHTHPDYSNPDLAPKLEPNWNPQLAPDLWTPANPFEETNSPTVQIAKKELDNANPTSPDPEVKPNPDTGGMTLPSFCDWASVVCDFVKDFNKEPDLQDEQLEVKEENITDYERKEYVTFGKTCPFTPHQASMPMGVLGEINFQTDLTFICTFGSEARPFVIGLGYLGGLIFLLIGIRNGNG